MTSHLIPLLLTMYIIIALISAIGKDLIVELAWKIYLLLPSPIRKQINLQKSLQHNLLLTSAALKSTSSQDEFAKWAKLNRQHDKQIQELSQVQAAVENHKTKFRRIVRVGVWLGTTGVKGGVQYWYSKQPVFWLPAGTFPRWVEYGLAFPKAPKGSVSTMVFGMCSNRVIGFVVGFVKDVVSARKATDVIDEKTRFQEITTEEKKEK